MVTETFQFTGIRTKNRNFTYLFLLDVKEPTPLFEKRRGRIDLGGVAILYRLWDLLGMAPRMGPSSRSCTFPLGRPVSRKAGKKIRGQ